MVKREVRQCLHCNKKIKDNEKQVDLITSDNKKEIEHVKFHFQCWADYFNQRVINKTKAQIELMQGRVSQIMQMPLIKGLLSNVAGSGMALNLLKIPLNKEFIIPNPKEQIKNQIQNDRQKRSGKKIR